MRLSAIPRSVFQLVGLRFLSNHSRTIGVKRTRLLRQFTQERRFAKRGDGFPDLDRSVLFFWRKLYRFGPYEPGVDKREKPAVTLSRGCW